jgi:lipopolysaccharide export LptBFGC system permease protein LptF
VLRFQRALLGEVLFVFSAIVLVVSAVVLAGTTLGLLSRGEGMGLGLVLDLVPRVLPIALSWSVPFSFLAAVALVVNRMVADHEVTAIRAAGLHLASVALPVLALGGLLSVGTILLNAFGVPESQRALREGVRQYLPAFLESLKEVDRTVALSDGRFSFGRYEDGAFWDVELDKRAQDGSLLFKLIARRAEIRRSEEGEDQEKALQFLFEDGYVMHAAQTGEPVLERRGAATSLQMGRVEKIGASVLFNRFFGTGRFLERARDLDARELVYSIERGGIWRGSLERLHGYLHRGLALGCSPLVFGLFALALGLLLPATGRRVRDFVLCFLPPVLAYFPLTLAGPALSRYGVLPPWLALWSADLVVGAIGLGMLWMAFRR